MHIHILGICGTFMGSLALLAREQGLKVTGCDANVYPPMSTQLAEAGIELIQGFDPQQTELGPDIYVIGNAMSRGNPLVEAILNGGHPYTSGPQFLADHILPGKWVLAVSGTHGKTTTSSILAWILEYAGYRPGFLIGGIPQNFGLSARLGDSDFFVVEADEYDCAFFDKRSKFIHYRPRTLVINNLEFDHADIFDDLAAIQRQFHHLVRTVPSEGSIVYPAHDQAVVETLAKGCWSQRVALFGLEEGASGSMTSEGWRAEPLTGEGNAVRLVSPQDDQAEFSWTQTGQHNLMNGLAAAAAAHCVGVPIAVAAEALSLFEGVKRRMELVADCAGVRLYDDFAHHPTAIRTTLEGLRRKYPDGHILAILEPRSNTMKLGRHQQELRDSIAAADLALWFRPEGLSWDLEVVCRQQDRCFDDLGLLIREALENARPGTHLVVMSNGGFQGIHQRLAAGLVERVEIGSQANNQ